MTAGDDYGLAFHAPRRVEAVPPCACPCHVAGLPSSSHWYCNVCHAKTWGGTPNACAETATYSHDEAVARGAANPRPYLVFVPDYYYITRGGTLEDALGEHFPTEEDARRRVDELNEYAAESALAEHPPGDCCDGGCG